MENNNTTNNDVNIAIALNSLQKDSTYVKSSIDQINARLKDMQSTTATKEETKVLEDKMNVKINTLEVDILFIKKVGYGVIAFLLYSIGKIIVDTVGITIK